MKTCHGTCCQSYIQLIAAWFFSIAWKPPCLTPFVVIIRSDKTLFKCYKVKHSCALHIYAITSSYKLNMKRFRQLGTEQQPEQDLDSKGYRLTLKGRRVKLWLHYTSTPSLGFQKFISPKAKADKTLFRSIKPTNPSVRMAYKGQISFGIAVILYTYRVCKTLFGPIKPTNPSVWMNGL